jgi:hypothetical protein
MGDMFCVQCAVAVRGLRQRCRQRLATSGMLWTMLELNRTAFPIPMLEQTFKKRRTKSLSRRRAGCTPASLDFTPEQSLLAVSSVPARPERFAAGRSAGGQEIHFGRSRRSPAACAVNGANPHPHFHLLEKTYAPGGGRSAAAVHCAHRLIDSPITHRVTVGGKTRCRA